MYFNRKYIQGSSFYIATFLVSIFYLATALTLGNPIDEGSIEPSFFPLILGSCAVIVTGLCLKNKIKENVLKLSENPLESESNSSERKVLLAVIITSSYILLFSLIGYFLSSVLYVFSMIVMFSQSRRNLISKLVISSVIVVLGYLLFEKLFNIHLPTLEV